MEKEISEALDNLTEKDQDSFGVLFCHASEWKRESLDKTD